MMYMNNLICLFQAFQVVLDLTSGELSSLLGVREAQWNAFGIDASIAANAGQIIATKQPVGHPKRWLSKGNSFKISHSSGLGIIVLWPEFDK